MPDQHFFEQSRITQCITKFWTTSVRGSRRCETGMQADRNIQFLSKRPERFHSRVVRGHALILKAHLAEDGYTARRMFTTYESKIRRCRVVEAIRNQYPARFGGLH